MPEDEAGRLETLRRYAILDTSPEEAFDDLARLASIICGTPIALVSLVDESRQWFKARVGLDATETPRDVAFCAHAILGTEVLVVPDASQDTRFASNPMVIEDPSIRFYVGAPLVAPDGHAMGTICAIDRKPRALTPEQIQAMQCISRQVVSQLELRRARAELMAALADKELLLGEVHHRVKNNLQIVQSIIDMQARRLVDTSAVGALRDAQNRVRSMALIHQTLYQSGEFGKIDFTRFLDTLVPHLRSSFAGLRAQIDIVASSEGITLSMEKAIPCGLIVNELVTNAFKYAFPERTTGRIAISLTADLGAAVLEVSDDGVGLPEGFVPGATSSLGMKLVQLLAEQIGGTLTLPRERQARFRITFPR